MQRQPPTITELARSDDGSVYLERRDFEDGSQCWRLERWNADTVLAPAVLDALKVLRGAVADPALTACRGKLDPP